MESEVDSRRLTACVSGRCIPGILTPRDWSPCGGRPCWPGQYCGVKRVGTLITHSSSAFAHTHHPRLAINAYLAAVHSEATVRGYSFDRSKIGPQRKIELIVVTTGQLAYEWDHLLGKLSMRSPALFDRLRALRSPVCHPLFSPRPGPVASWERARAPSHAAQASGSRCRLEERMDKPRIFLGSSGKQEKLLQALTRGLEDVAHVEPWTTSFNPGTTTLERLLELTHEVDFAAFVFAQDDWTTNSPPASPAPGSGQASPRDNVVFEAGLFGGVLGMRRTFILHASGSKLPSDLLGLTCVRYEATTPAEMKVVNQKLRKAIENEGRVARIEGLWWQFSLTERTARGAFRREPSEDFAGPRRRAGAGRPFMARGWPPVSEILERSGEGEEGAFGRLLLLEGRTAAGPERAAVGRDGGDPDGVGRARVRVLHDSCGHAARE